MESLLEFEEALASSCTSNSNPLLLQTLENKLIDRLNCPTPFNQDYTEDDLNRAMLSYSYATDEFTSCSKCGTQLNNTAAYKNCCRHFIELKNYISLHLEKTYWVSLINNPTGTINTLPNYTTMLILQQGIPLQLRSIVWNRLLLVGETIPETSSLIYENFQHSYNQDISKQISKDLYRTFPNVTFFTMEKTIENLSTILNVYANFDAELGYCQGLLFLVGVLYYHFQNDSPALTFHSLVVIMQSELELRDIFTASTMSTELNNWLEEFLQILEIVDVELFNHLLQNVGIEFQVFLFQWWLSFISSHIPDLSIINRIIDVCLTQGWKVGLFKISLGLLLVNKPILMTFEKGDEEVIYQHLLNESRWGIAVNDLDLFFGKTLMSWDDVKLFTKLNEVQENMFIPPLKGNGHARTSSNIIDTFKQLSITLGRTRSNSDNANISPQSASSSTSSLSVFSADTGSNGNGAIRSRNSELESIYSDLTSTHSDEKTPSLPAAATGGASGLFSNYLKFPYNHSSPSKSENESLIEENKNLKELLREALDMIEKGERNEMIVHEIKGVIG